jgi:proline iminopeptidase
MKKITVVVLFLLVPAITSALTLEQGEFKAKLNGLELWYKVSGKGLVCLIPSPGLGVGVDCLFGLKPLEEQFTMVYLETRCTGRSEQPKTTKEYTLDHFVEDLEALRRHLKQGQIWLMGHSQAGMQIMGYALKYPKRVKGLILLSSLPGYDGEWNLDFGAQVGRRAKEPWFPDANQALSILFHVLQTKDEEMRSLFLRALPFYFHDQGILKRNAPAFEGAAFSANAHRGCGESGFFSGSLAPRLHEIRAPTLIVVGSDDFVCSPAQAQRLHLGIPCSKLLLIEDAGHFIWMEQPEAFFSGIRKFLSALGYKAQ